MLKELRTTITLFLLLMIVTGFAYPLITLALGQTFFSVQANGSLIESEGKIIGSRLIGQTFVGDNYFHPRPSAAGNGYDAANSSASNLGPSNTDLLKTVSDRVGNLRKSTKLGLIPVDLVTASASGLDPDISPASAYLQATRVAIARHMSTPQIEAFVTEHIISRTWGILGENRVNVLELNQALDHDFTKSSRP